MNIDGPHGRLDDGCVVNGEDCMGDLFYFFYFLSLVKAKALELLMALLKSPLSLK